MRALRTMPRLTLPFSASTRYAEVDALRELWRGDVEQLEALDVRVRELAGADQYRRTHPELVR